MDDLTIDLSGAPGVQPVENSCTLRAPRPDVVSLASVGIIVSAAYIDAEMAAEFGRLPPAFLPVGNSRLFKFQAELLHKLADRVVLTLPQSFVPSEHDRHLLAALDVAVVSIPDGLALAESMMLAIIQSINGDESLFVLHGDTLFLGLEGFSLDGLSVHGGEHPYPWAVALGGEPIHIAPVDDSGRRGAAIVSGLFGFSRGLAFLKCLAASKTDFLTALNSYARQFPQFGVFADCGRWLDFGHLNTYYDSRRALTTERAFNTLSIAHNVVSKTSRQRDKIEAEARWFEALPATLRSYVPAYLGRAAPVADRHGYCLAYEYLCPLSDLYVFGALAPVVWGRILASCGDVLSQMRSVKPQALEGGICRYLYADKAIARFRSFAEQAGISPDHDWTINGQSCPSPQALIDQMARIVGAPDPKDIGVLHGDFCFSNILFDFRSGTAKLIDPRGYVEPGKPCLFGDTRYDIGKLHHSIVGRYDFIVAGYYSLTKTGPYALSFDVAAAAAQRDLERYFCEIICQGDADLERTAAAISVLLFLSMLPLHAEDPRRQWAFLANSYRVHRRYFGGAT